MILKKENICCKGAVSNQVTVHNSLTILEGSFSGLMDDYEQDDIIESQQCTTTDCENLLHQ